MTLIVKKHSDKGRMVLAICDEDLIGKKFETDIMVLDLTSNFYKGEKMPVEEIKDLLKKAYTINAVGKNSVNLLKEENLVKETMKVDDVPYAYVFFDN